MEAKKPVKITKKITGYKVITLEETTEAPKVSGGTVSLTDTLVQQLEELEAFEASKDIAFKTTEAIELVIKKELKRPLRLDNEWRLKPPYANHALYVRLNAITHEGKKYPYEVFFNTKDVKDIKWLNALTVTISTAFRTAIETGTSLQPLIDNFKESCDTESPYLSRVPEKPKFVNGLVAEIGLVIEGFNNECLAWNYSESSHERPATEEELSWAGKPSEILESFGATKEAVNLVDSIESEGVPYQEQEPEGYPIHATVCTVCGIKAVILLDGCGVCLDCGNSKCS